MAKCCDSPRSEFVGGSGLSPRFGPAESERSRLNHRRSVGAGSLPMFRALHLEAVRYQQWAKFATRLMPLAARCGLAAFALFLLQLWRHR